MKFGIFFTFLLPLILHAISPALGLEEPNPTADYLNGTETIAQTSEIEEEEVKDPLLVTLPEFGQLRGFDDVSTKGKKFYSFTGIPYAKPPIGELRFKNPDYYPQWEGEREATKMPEPCPQFDITKYLSTNEAPFLGQEDCLYLNIYTPKTKVRKFDLPVLIYLHGGSYISGSASDYLPHKIMNEDVVLVVLQFRLGVLGFLSTEDSVMPGNLGLKDQTMAFRWITRYIEFFGGESLKATLVGSDTGAAMAHFHSLSHYNLGYFSKAIMQSGTALCPWALGGVHRQAAQFLSKNLCKTEADEVESTSDDATIPEAEDPSILKEKVSDTNGTSDESNAAEDAVAEEEEKVEEVEMTSEEIRECLLKADAETLTMAAKDFFAWTMFPVIFGPYVDGNFLVSSPEWLLKNKRHKRMDMIVGVNKHDGGFITNALYRNEGNRHALQQMFSQIGPVSLEFTDADVAPLNMTIKSYHRYNHGLKMNADNADNFTMLFGDRHYAMCSEMTAKLHVKNNDGNYKKKKVFFYEFEHKGHRSTNDEFNLTIGSDWVSHGDENFLLFPMKGGDDAIVENEEDEKMSEMLIKMWVNFAGTGNPTPDDSLGFTWTPFTTKSMNHLIIDMEPQMKNNSWNETRHFWDNLPTQQNLQVNKKNFPDLVEQDKDMDEYEDDEEEEEEEISLAEKVERVREGEAELDDSAEAAVDENTNENKDEETSNESNDDSETTIEEDANNIEEQSRRNEL